MCFELLKTLRWTIFILTSSILLPVYVMTDPCPPASVDVRIQQAPSIDQLQRGGHLGERSDMVSEQDMSAPILLGGWIASDAHASPPSGYWKLVDVDSYIGSWANNPPNTALKYKITVGPEGGSLERVDHNVGSNFGCTARWSISGRNGSSTKALISGDTVDVDVDLRVTKKQQASNLSCTIDVSLMPRREDPGVWSGGASFFPDSLSVGGRNPSSLERKGSLTVPQGNSGELLVLRLQGGPGQSAASFAYYFLYRWEGEGSTGQTPARSSQVPLQPSKGFEGTWATDFGAVTLTGVEMLTGSYNDGALYLTPTANQLVGYWVQSRSDHRCTKAHRASYYWGKVRFTLQEDGRSLVGHWGYCDSEQGGGSWSGTR